MKTGRTRNLIIGGSVAALILIAAIVAVLLFNINSYKSKIETAASDATGLEVKIKGRMGLSFFPFSLSAKDVRVAGKGGEILSLRRLKLRTDLIPLLGKKLTVNGLELVKPAVTIVRDARGEYNFETNEIKSLMGRPGPAFRLNELKLTGGTLVYLDKKTDEKTELKEMNLVLRDVALADAWKGLIRNVSFTGTMDCKELLQKDLRIENIKASVRAIKGTYRFQPFTIGSLVHSDKKGGEKTEIKEISLAIKDMAFADPSSGDVAKDISFTGTMDCKELLQKDLHIENIKASVRAIKGTYHFQPFTIGSLVHSDKKGGEKTEIKEISLAIRDIALADPSSGDIAKDISFTGTMDCKELRKKDLKVNHIKSPVKAEKGLFSFKPLTMEIFETQGEGDMTADKSETEAEYKINLSVSNLDFEKLQQSFGVKRLIGGKGDLVVSLTMKDKGNRSLLETMNGTISLRGNNLTTYTMDLDKVLSTYETSQKFSLADIGAFFIAGPLGTVALKGYHYGDVYYQTQGGQGAITQFVSHWVIRNGLANATDCALATRHNRVALKGRLNLVNEQFDNVTVALLDDKGCPTFKQTITGSFANPRPGTVSAVESLAGPVLNLYRMVKRYVQKGKCKPFYRGSVKQPR